MLQLQGTLGDAISATKLRSQRPQLFGSLTHGDAAPVDNIHVLPHRLEDFAAAITPELNRVFVHSFFNPRRIEAELDFVMERELAERRDGVSDEEAVAAPACTGRSCCGY